MAIQAWPSRLPILKKSSFFKKQLLGTQKCVRFDSNMFCFGVSFLAGASWFFQRLYIKSTKSSMYKMELELPRMSGIMSFHVLAVPQALLFQTPQLFLSWTPRSLWSTLIHNTIRMPDNSIGQKIQWTWDCKGQKGPPNIMFTSFSLRLVLVQDLVLAGFGPSRLTRPRTPCFCFLGVPTYTLDQTNCFGCPQAHLLFFGNLSGGCCSFQNHSTSSLISWLAAGSNSRRDDWKIETVQPALLQRACACVWKLRALKFMALLYMYFNLIVSSEFVGVGGSFRQSHTVDGSPILEPWCITQWRNYQARRVQDWTAHRRYIMRCHHVIRFPLNSKLCTLFPRPSAFAPLVAASAPQMPVLYLESSQHFCCSRPPSSWLTC